MVRYANSPLVILTIFSVNCCPTKSGWVRESHNDHSATRCLQLHKTLESGTSTQLFLCVHSEGRQAGVSRISLPVTPPGRINKRECTILDRARQRQRQGQGQGREAEQHLSTHYVCVGWHSVYRHFWRCPPMEEETVKALKDRTDWIQAFAGMKTVASVFLSRLESWEREQVVKYV